MKSDKEQNWVQIQIKGLSSWVNSYLKPANFETIKDLQKDLQDGIKLNQFLSIVSGTKINYDPKPQMKIHKIQNLATAVNFAQENLKVKLIGISAEDIESGNISLILGFIYSTFRTVRISKIASQLGEGDKKKNEAQQLIAWMNTVVENPPYELHLETFKDEPFKNGKTFGALLHAYNKELWDYEGMGDETEENLRKIFEIYEQKLGIPQLLDPSEVMNGTCDERAMTLYSSLIYHAHASQEERKKMEEGRLKSEQEHIMSRKELQEKFDQLMNEKEEIDREREKIRLEKEEEERRRLQLEKEKEDLERERERLRKEKEEMERLRDEQERLRKLAEGENQDLNSQKSNLEKERLKDEEERKRLEELIKKLLKDVQNGISNELNLRDKMLYLYQALMDDRYSDIENFLSNDKSGSSSGGDSNSQGGDSNSQGGESGSSSKTRTIHSGDSNSSGSGDSNSNNTSGGSDEGQTGQRSKRIVRTSPTEDIHMDLTNEEGIEKERKRTFDMQKRLERELDELKERIKQEIQRRKKDALKLNQYEEKLKEYESKAIEQGEANRALDILKKNLIEHVEDLKVWVDLSEFDLDSEKKEKYDPSLIRSNLKDKKFDEQIDILAEQLQSENDSMRRVLQIKDSKKQIYDNYADKQGSLLMRTDEKSEWKTQWFVLKASELSYFPTEEKKDRAGGINIDFNSNIISEKKAEFKGQTIFPLKITLQSGTNLFIAASTKKAKKEWACVLRGKVIFSDYMNKIEESKTRPDIRLNNLLFATVDLGSIRMDNAPLSKYTVEGVSKALASFEDLNVVTFSNSEFTDDLASVIAPSLKTAFIRTLNLSENHLTSTGAKLICESFLENRSVESIDFSGNEIGDESSGSFASLISHKKVSSINFEDNKITSEGAKKILEALVEHPTWSVVQLNGNQLGDEGCKYVEHLITKNSGISELQLARNRISDDGVKHLCNALRNNTSITHIDLSGNLLSHTAISYINDLLKDNKTIKLLNLSENPQIIGGKNLEAVFSNEAFSLSSFSLMRIL
eukprot:TRINITY_DN54_c0_g1_i2.p1 TRINITY_DN54_c0_g1~~TRINITY_DN54_c0_g1_i2.p1  ORF type:complete len:1029 (-),score=426.23 TRINITY_DN54_c0_g1_i2:67-3153(-)